MFLTVCNQSRHFAVNMHITLGTIFIDYVSFSKSFSDKVKAMVLTARTETLIPLIYMITLLMAYFGPNAEILGTIKLEIWHYDNTIDDIWASLYKIGLLWIVDIFCQIINSILIWKYCNISMFKILVDLQKELWLQMAFGEALLIVDVSIK